MRKKGLVKAIPFALGQTDNGHAAEGQGIFDLIVSLRFIWNGIPLDRIYIQQHYTISNFPRRNLGQNKPPLVWNKSLWLVITALFSYKISAMPSGSLHSGNLMPLRCYNYGDKQAAHCWAHYKLGAVASRPLQPAGGPQVRPPCETPRTQRLIKALTDSKQTDHR